MWQHPEAAGGAHRVQARLESPRGDYATPGFTPGGLAPLDGGSSRRSTVMRLGPTGQPAHSRVIRRRSRLTRWRPGASGAHRLQSPNSQARWATPLGALRAWERDAGGFRILNII